MDMKTQLFISLIAKRWSKMEYERYEDQLAPLMECIDYTCSSIERIMEIYQEVSQKYKDDVIGKPLSLDSFLYDKVFNSEHYRERGIPDLRTFYHEDRCLLSGLDISYDPDIGIPLMPNLDTAHPDDLARSGNIAVQTVEDKSTAMDSLAEYLKKVKNLDVSDQEVKTVMYTESLDKEIDYLKDKLDRLIKLRGN